MKNALTVDLEDWYHPELVRKHIRGDVESQIVDSTNQILRLLDRHRVKATFFVLGEVARKHPMLIRTIHDKGHEIASHGMSHTPLWELEYDSLDKELKTFDKLMVDILGNRVKIKGFRAPTFSMDNRTRYALKCLMDNQYLYDTSIFPAQNYMYGLNDAPCAVYRPDLNNLSLKDGRSEIIEFPLTVFKWGRIRIPVSGGFYLRIFPYFMFKFLLKRINKKRPFVIYFHPWEIHPETPRVKAIGLKNYFITYYSLNGALKKIENLLRDFEFEPMINVIDRVTQEKGRDDQVKDYFERCADRFDGFYKEEKRSLFQQLAHVVFRKPGLVRRFKTTADILGDVNGKTILDVGCGSGIYSIYFAKRGAEVTGIDFSPSMLSLAEKNARGENCKIHFMSGDFLKREIDSHFDYSLFIGVFDYVKKDGLLDYFGKALRITNQKIVATFPKRYALLQTPIRYFWLKRQHCPVYFYTKRQVEKIAEQLGLSLKFHNCGPIWTVEFTKKQG